MANKTTENQKKQLAEQKRRERYDMARNKTRYYHIICIALCALALLLFFVNFAEVYNTDAGVEVKVSGWSFFLAGITGNYSSSDSVYGDLAVPFYYYAKLWCKGIGVLAVIAVFLTLVLIVLEVIIVVTKKHSLTYAAVFFGFIDTVLLLAIFIVALYMKEAKILSVYCSGNPACSIRSYAVLPLLAVLAYTVFNGFISAKLVKAYMES